jgi:hypothetical protein
MKKKSYQAVAKEKSAGARKGLQARGITKRDERIRIATERELRKKRALATSEEARITRAVRIIKQRERRLRAKGQSAPGVEYVLHNKRALFNSGRVRGQKIG